MMTLIQKKMTVWIPPVLLLVSLFSLHAKNEHEHPGKTRPTPPPGPVAMGAVFISDLIIPGSGALYHHHPWRASVFFITRSVSAAGAIEYYNRYVNYRSATRAARMADLYYGGGLVYMDPYEPNRYRSSISFAKEAGRYNSYRSAMITVHLIFTAISLYFTYDDFARMRAEKHSTYDLSDTEVRMSYLQPSWQRNDFLLLPGQSYLGTLEIPITRLDF